MGKALSAPITQRQYVSDLSPSLLIISRLLVGPILSTAYLPRGKQGM